MNGVYEISIDIKSNKCFLGIWERKENVIRNLGQPDLEYKIDSADDICEAIIATNYYPCCDKSILKTDFQLESIKVNVKVGYYFPRIFKPTHTAYENEFHILEWTSDNRGIAKELREAFRDKNKTRLELPHDKVHLINSVEQLKTLIEMLNRILRTIHPCTKNLNSFGFETRNLILLTCTEFESQISGILRENNIKSITGNYTTKDYVKLKDELFLKSYSVKFTKYPELPEFRPFQDWSEEKPTASLSWYECYNKIKHDNEYNFEKASLNTLLNSISACFIILIAQYGENEEIKEITSRFWKITSTNMLGMVYKYEYISPQKNLQWKKMNLNI